MTDHRKMNGLTKTLVLIVLLVHFGFFLLEAVLWMQPAVYTTLISKLNNPIDLGDLEQALVLKNLFVNQGFYNLFLVSTGGYGYYLVENRQYSAGYLLIMVLCLSGTGAGLILLFSTKAYLLAAVQIITSALAYAKTFSMYRS